MDRNFWRDGFHGRWNEFFCWVILLETYSSGFLEGEIYSQGKWWYPWDGGALAV